MGLAHDAEPAAHIGCFEELVVPGVTRKSDTFFPPRNMPFSAGHPARVSPQRLIAEEATMLLLLPSLTHLSGQWGKKVRGKAKPAFAVSQWGSCALQGTARAAERLLQGRAWAGKRRCTYSKVRDLQLLEVLVKAPDWREWGQCCHHRCICIRTRLPLFQIAIEQIARTKQGGLEALLGKGRLASCQAHVAFTCIA